VGAKSGTGQSTCSAGAVKVYSFNAYGLLIVSSGAFYVPSPYMASNYGLYRGVGDYVPTGRTKLVAMDPPVGLEHAEFIATYTSCSLRQSAVQHSRLRSPSTRTWRRRTRRSASLVGTTPCGSTRSSPSPCSRARSTSCARNCAWRAQITSRSSTRTRWTRRAL
jgi:hypothetical protein